jgi:hypothetical protein
MVVSAYGRPQHRCRLPTLPPRCEVEDKGKDDISPSNTPEVGLMSNKCEIIMTLT